MGVLNIPKYLQCIVQISYEGDLDAICAGMDRQMTRDMPECMASSSKSCLDSVKTVCSCWIAAIVTDTINLEDLKTDIRRII
jgi:hypothetical protein